MSEGIAEDEIRHPTKELTVGEEIAIEMVAVHKWYGQFHVLKVSVTQDMTGLCNR